MKKTAIILASALLLAGSAFAQEKKAAPQLENHFKLYGFVRNYFAFDTRECLSGTEDLYFYMPKDQSMSDGTDLNAVPSFRFAALTSRVGLDVFGYEFAGYKMGAKIEADFYCGVSGVTGTAQLRLRQAYVTIAKNNHSWKVGQAWHPVAVDLPDIFSLESGAPFNPFSRTPQVAFDAAFSKTVSLTAAAIWQMQYTSTGPEGASANYIKYGCTPEMFLGLNFKGKSGVFKVGADLLSIKPRRYDATGKSLVSDRLTTVNVFEYGQLTTGGLTLKEKVTYANDGSHMNMVGGYGVSEIRDDGSWEYCATRNISAWVTAQYKAKDSRWIPSIMFGYSNNLGTAKEVGTGWYKNNASTIAQLLRVQPEIIYRLGKLDLGLEYMMTAAQYGKDSDFRLHASTDLHWVINHRIQAMVKFNF